MKVKKKLKPLWAGASFCFAAYLLVGLGRIWGQGATEISGLIIDESGSPVKGALVGVLEQRVATMKEAQTDVGGRFRVTELSNTSLYRIVVTKYGYSQITVEDVKPSSQELKIQMKRAALPSQPAAPSSVPSVPNSGEMRGAQELPFTLSVSVQEILLNVSVEDPSGRQITNLRKEDFRVLQDGVLQEILYFGHENVPLSAVLLMDTSSSMQGSQIVEAKVAALAFIEQSRPQDVISLIAFNDKVELVRPFTQEMLQVRTGIHSLTARGGTALFDAISKSIDLLQQAPHPRHVIVLLSDGKDEDSLTKFAAIDKKVQAGDTLIFSIGEYADLDRKLFISGKKYYKPPEHDVNLNPVWVLRYFAELSGGKAFFPKLGDPLEPFFAQIAQELHQQYVITYQPTATKGQGNFHTIDVQVKGSNYSASLKVRTRKGYLSEPPS
ncbi:MAG: hypothetical protein DMG06_00005 [Acidobacteria bacterium]|nr:MAG: hypothetical protein DMG06_00005 [Acidobacteriota bacterium]